MKKLFQKISTAHLFAFVIMLGTPSLQAAVTQVSATVDKNPVMVDESFTLEIVADDNISADAFDPSPLLKDFVVGRTSSSRQTQIINFDTSRTTRWSTVLIPRKPGRFSIPAFKINGISTQSIMLQVLPVSQSKHAQRQDMFITTEVDLDEVYLQQQVKYTVKLHIAVDLQRGSLSAPTMEEGEIEQVGDDKEYHQIVDGRRYRIIERIFSIMPQKSGTFSIQAPLFEGEVLDNSRRSFGFFNRTSTINKVGKNLFLKVNPIPDNYAYHWLPSEHVEINDEWQGMSDNLTVGEPVTRTITLTALGVVESQLPEIGSNYPDSVKTYPDQADTATVQRNGTFVAQRKESVAIIPNKDGTVVIPEVKVPWFNVVTKSTEFAILPEKRFTITPPAGSSASTPEPQLNSPAVNTEPTESNPIATGTPTSIVATPQWWSLSSWFLLVLWILTLIVWWMTKKRQLVTDIRQENITPWNAEALLWKQVEAAIKQKDEQNLTNYLQPWLAEVCGNPQQSLSKSVEQLRNDQLSQQITVLFGNRFGDKNNQPNAHELLNSLLETLKIVRKQYQHKPNIKGTTLHPLYPHTQ